VPIDCCAECKVPFKDKVVRGGALVREQFCGECGVRRSDAVGEDPTDTIHQLVVPPLTNSPTSRVHSGATGGTGSAAFRTTSSDSAAFSKALDVAHLHDIGYGDLQAATNGFAKERVLGKGGFATVYLGQLAGQDVAVKVDVQRADEGNAEESAKLAKILKQQFTAEITCLYQYTHPNICALLHHSIDGPTRCLVYEYCPHGALHGNIESLSWQQRLRVAVGTGRGLAYLHSATPDPIVHRDVKPMNSECMDTVHCTPHLMAIILTTPHLLTTHYLPVVVILIDILIPSVFILHPRFMLAVLLGANMEAKVTTRRLTCEH
jgi:hypothetical protein